MSTYTVIGTRPIRHDGADKVTGRAQYGADYTAAGLLHGFILRSPHAHARILRIDTSNAAAFPGVRAVVTAADLPETADRIVDLGILPILSVLIGVWTTIGFGILMAKMLGLRPAFGALSGGA